MPRVPIIAENEQRLRPVANDRAAVVDFTSGGRQIGGALQRTGQAVAQYAEDQDRLDAALDQGGAKTLNNELVIGAQALRDKVRASQGYAADKARTDALGELASLRSGLEAKLTTPRMRKMFNDVANEQVAGWTSEFNSHATGQIFKADDDAGLARLTIAGDEAAATTDPASRTKWIDTGIGEIEARGARMGWGADTVKAERLKFTSDVHQSVVEKMLLADDIDGAVAYRDSHLDALTSGAESKIASMLHDPLERRDTNSYVDKVMGIATGGETSATFSYSDPLHGAGRTPVPGGQFGAGRDYGSHKGVDIPAAMGSPVYSSSPGIARVTSSKLGGTTVTVDDGNGHVTRYMHLGKVSIKDGDRVTPDTQIGAVGVSGRSSGPHLHYEVLQNGKAVDPKGVAGKVQQSPQRHDMNAIFARIDADPSLTPEQRDRYKQEAERRVGRDEQLLNRAEDAAQRSALEAIGKLGPDGFTSMTQIPANIRGSLSARDRLTFMNMADANVKARATGQGVVANGSDAFNLNMMAIYQPDAFKALNLGMYQGRITNSELESLAKTQGQMRTKPPETTDHGKIWGVINRGAEDIGLDLSAKTRLAAGKAGKIAPDQEKALRIFTMVQADLNTRTAGQRQPTDDEVQASYDRAVRQVVVNGDTANPRRAYEVIGAGPAARVPDRDRQQIVAAYRRRYGRDPSEGAIASAYAARGR